MARLCGCTPRLTSTRGRLFASLARYAAAPTALGPSYTEALETGRPVSSEIAVWYSNITCSPPWLTSGW